MKHSVPVITFNFLYSFRLPERRKTRGAIISLFGQEKKALKRLDYIFCPDDYLLKINQEYLQHDSLTDIITFDLSDDQHVLRGEVYISIERVQENSLKFDVPFLTELHRVIFHGALHLCGYKDKKPGETKEMREKENKYLNMFLP